MATIVNNNHSPILELPLDGSTDLGGVFDGVLDAYRSDGFNAGYHRAVNDALADLMLVCEEHIREQQCDTPAREALRAFARKFEKHLDRLDQGKPRDQYVDGGLGI